MSHSLEPFAQLLGGDDSRIDLARACLMIAQDAYPGLDVDRYLGEIERMAIRLRARMPQANAAEERVVALNQFLFDDLGYWGNTDDYYDPRNSYLNEVIDRKTGTPISLSILYMELGRRIGLPLEGVSFPGHFLVRLRLRGGTLVLDPFAGGAPQSEAELRDRGYVYRRLECWRPALKDLSDYVEREPEAPDLDDVRVKLMELSALCARLN